MNTNAIFSAVLMIFGLMFFSAQENYNTLIFKGNQQFDKKNYDNASSKYMEAAKLNETLEALRGTFAEKAEALQAVNDELNDSPELVNSEPYAGGWIFKIKASDEAQVDALLDATAYEALLEDE